MISRRRFFRKFNGTLRPRIVYNEIAWEKETESLDNVLQEIQKEIFDKESSEKVISDKIIKVRLKNKQSKILFIHKVNPEFINDFSKNIDYCNYI